MESMKNKDETYWFEACFDGDNWVYQANPRGRGAKAKRFVLTLAVQRQAEDYVLFGYVSDAGATLHPFAPMVLTEFEAQTVGQSFMDAAREANDDLVKWPNR